MHPTTHPIDIKKGQLMAVFEEVEQVIVDRIFLEEKASDVAIDTVTNCGNTLTPSPNGHVSFMQTSKSCADFVPITSKPFSSWGPYFGYTK